MPKEKFFDDDKKEANPPTSVFDDECSEKA